MSRGPKLKALVAAEVAGLVLVIIAVVVLARPALPRVPAIVQPPSSSTPASPPPSPTARPTGTPTRAPTATPTATLTPPPTPTPPISAIIPAATGRLRLRASPGTTGQIITELPAGAELLLVGRTADNTWLEVTTADDLRGWVAARFVEVSDVLDGLPVTGTAVEAPGSNVPYLSGISAHARAVFLQGLTLGNREFAFSVVGDSNTDNPAFLAAFDLGQYSLGDYAYLEDTIHYFEGSFIRDSAAALGGFNTAKVLDPAQADGRCAGGESPLACEYRLHRPSAALILLGTGDQHAWQGFEARYRQIIEYTEAQGVVPVLITKVDDLESLENTAAPGYINSVIRRLAVEYDVPLLDLRLAVEALPNRGTLADGFHYNSPPDGRTTTFDAEHLRYGFTVRNLTALQALDALRRYVLYAPATPAP